MGEKIGADERLRQHLPFVVAGHNYGRLDLEKPENLETAKEGLVAIIEDAAQALMGIAMVEADRKADKLDDVS